MDPNTLFRALFLAQLPPDVCRILATSDKTDIGELAIEADRITEVSRLSNDLQVNAANPVQQNRQQTIPKVGMGSAVPISRTWEPLLVYANTTRGSASWPEIAHRLASLSLVPIRETNRPVDGEQTVGRINATSPRFRR